MRTVRLSSSFLMILCVLFFAGCTCGDDDDDNDTGDLPILDDTDTTDDATDDTGDDTDDDTGSDDTGDDDTVTDDTADDTSDDTSDDTGDDDTFIPDYVVSFDGSTAYADTAGDFSPSLPNTFTFEGWASLENAAPEEDQVLIHHWFTDAKTTQGVEIWYSSSNYAFIYGYFDINTGYNYIESIAVAPTNTWFHFACTYSDDGSTSNFCLYIDGVEQGCDTGDILGTINTHLKLGILEWDDSCHLEGVLNEVRISSVVRYDDDFTVPTGRFALDSDTIALYHFDEGTGSTIGDSTTNDNDLDLYGNYDWLALSK